MEAQEKLWEDTVMTDSPKSPKSISENKRLAQSRGSFGSATLESTAPTAQRTDRPH